MPSTVINICLILGAILCISVVCLGEKKVQSFFTNKTVRTGIAVLAGVIMYYTPDDIDRIILAILAFFEISPLIISTTNKHDIQ